MKHKYEQLQVSTDDDGGETADASPERFSLNGAMRSVRRSRIVSNITLVVGCILVVVNTVLFYKNRTHGQSLERGVYPSLVPPMSLKVETFEQQLIYAAPPSPESDAAWDKLLPPGRGFVMIEDGKAQALGLEPGQPHKNVELYSVTVFHQLHCLGMLRAFYWRLLQGAAEGDPDVKQFAIDRGQDSHAQHCWDYLRQGLQCNADLTLEWPIVRPDGQRKSVDGWHVPHLCKNWDNVMEYMDKNHFNASVRTDIIGEAPPQHDLHDHHEHHEHHA